MKFYKVFHVSFVGPLEVKFIPAYFIMIVIVLLFSCLCFLMQIHILI